MNEKTEQLIRELAEKLGTTGEHLWSVLVKQAQLSSAVDCVCLCILAAVCIFGYRITLERTKDGGPWNDGYGSSALPWILWAVLTLGALTFLCSVASGIVAGFINPEYVALREILQSIKK